MTRPGGVRTGALAVALAATLAFALLGTHASASPRQADGFVIVRPDARLCPSPLCGGAWIRRVNRAATRCADGSLAPECYVASTPRLPQLQGSPAVGMLARGRPVPAGLDGFPALAMLRVSAAWRPAGGRLPRGTTFRVVDTGLRCVTTPCFSLAAIPLERGARRTLSGLDLSRVGATAADLARAQRLTASGGLLVTGTVAAVADAGPAGDGRTLRATQLWLPVPLAGS